MTITNDSAFKQRLTARFFIRFHMMFMLAGVALTGVGTSKLLLMVGVSMPVRYAIAIVCSWLAFFILVRLWLWYIGLKTRTSDGGRSGSGAPDLPTGGGGTEWQDGGGRSGGGGAAASWDDGPVWLNETSAQAPAVDVHFSHSHASLGGGGGGGGAADIDPGDAWVLVVLLIVVLVAVFGAAGYFVYQAPAILADVALEAALASGLVRVAGKLDRGDWKGNVLKATWIPFVIVLVAAVGFGLAAIHYCPDASKAADIFHECAK